LIIKYREQKAKIRFSNFRAIIEDLIEEEIEEKA
jgi:hypothetical protein